MAGLRRVIARAYSQRQMILISHLSLMFVLTDNVKRAPLCLLCPHLLDLQVFGSIPLVGSHINDLSRQAQR